MKVVPVVVSWGGVIHPLPTCEIISKSRGTGTLSREHLADNVELFLSPLFFAHHLQFIKFEPRPLELSFASILNRDQRNYPV